jgi:hypothetical protein
MTILVDATVHSEHGPLIRCDISPRSVERSRDIENGTISEKIQWIIHLGQLFKQRCIFLKA